MAKYVSEEKLRNIEKYYAARGISPIVPIGDLIRECQELNPWMTLDEFLKSGHKGWCWIVEITREPASLAYFDLAGEFNDESGFIQFDRQFITHVQPIHKPEPPR